MTRQNVKERCRGICAGYNEKRVCGFADGDSLLGFIDTSQGQNGTRGIAFAEDFVLMNFDGEIAEVRYDSIKNVQIISSFEDFFADELLVSYSDGASDKEIRISDFSLDKSELKRLLDELCGKGAPKKRVPEKTAANPAKGIVLPQDVINLPPRGLSAATDSRNNANKGSVSAPENADRADKTDKPERVRVEDQYTINENVARLTGKKLIRPVPDASPDTSPNVSPDVSPERKTRIGGAAVIMPQPRTFENERRVVFPENNLNENRQPSAVSQSARAAEQPILKEAPKTDGQRPDDYEDIVFENRAPVITETVVNTPMRTTVIEREPPVPQEPKNPTTPPRDEFEDETAERIRIQNMTPEETLSYLSQSLNEINAPAPRVPEPKIEVRERAPVAPAPERKAKPQVRAAKPVQEAKKAAEETVPAENKYEKLTEEPIWGDIYIKASRDLRELCESGRLSMQQIEAELDDKLLDSARAFAEITSDESKIPKVLIPKITELREAARNFDNYFQSGEDIAVRAMFFMLYQMLSYADRIVETPETKERLNDFFRRFGPAGITLSMLDMRV